MKDLSSAIEDDDDEDLGTDDFLDADDHCEAGEDETLSESK